MRYVDGVPENIWNFHVGGYQACEKRLKDSRTLFEEDILPCERVAAPFIDAPPVASLYAKAPGFFKYRPTMASAVRMVWARMVKVGCVAGFCGKVEPPNIKRFESCQCWR